jgi:hypothetical protein
LQSFLRWSPRSSNHRRSPRTFPSAVHPPTSFSSPPESYETAPTACRFRLGGSSHEVPCLFAPSTSRVRRRDGFHTTAAVRPQVFATSRRFAPRDALRACFIPQARPGFSLQGLSLARSRHGSSPQPCPLAVTAIGAPLARRPSRSSTSRPCSPGESVAPGPRLSEPDTRSPLGLSSLQGLLHLGRRPCHHDPPLTSLPHPRTGRVLRRSTGSRRPKDGTSLARPPALLRFLAFSIPQTFGRALDRAYRFASGGMPRRRNTVLTSWVLRRPLPQPSEQYVFALLPAYEFSQESHRHNSMSVSRFGDRRVNACIRLTASTRVVNVQILTTRAHPDETLDRPALGCRYRRPGRPSGLTHRDPVGGFS